MKKHMDGSVDRIADIVVAAYESDLNTVRKLLEQGEDPNSVDERDNLSLLHIGCLQGDVGLVNLLLEHDEKHGNLDFTIRSSYRPRLAWQFAANGNYFELAERVHEAGIAKQKRNNFPNPPKPEMR